MEIEAGFCGVSKNSARVCNFDLRQDGTRECAQCLQMYCSSDDAIIIWLLVVGRRRWLRACGIGMAG
jgi:hypothetical protein